MTKATKMEKDQRESPSCQPPMQKVAKGGKDRKIDGKARFAAEN